MFQTQKNGWDGPVLGVKQATENKRQFDDEVSIFITFMCRSTRRINRNKNANFHILIAAALGTESWSKYDWVAIWNQQGRLPGKTVKMF